MGQLDAITEARESDDSSCLREPIYRTRSQTVRIGTIADVVPLHSQADEMSHDDQVSTIVTYNYVLVF